MDLQKPNLSYVNVHNGEKFIIVTLPAAHSPRPADFIVFLYLVYSVYMYDVL